MLGAVAQYPCPCCGFLVFDEQAGSYDICEICGWEDDLSQLRFPNTPGESNHVSLITAQKNFQKTGSSDPGRPPLGRAPSATDVRDPDSRPIDEVTDDIEHSRPGIEYGATYPKDSAKLYYWRRSFWRSKTNAN